MTEDLAYGLSAQDGQSAETIKSEAITGAEAAQSLIGQAAVLVSRPGAGETVQIPAEPGQTIIVDFAAADARIAIEGDHFVLVFEDGGRLVFLNLVTLALSDNPPNLEIAGVPIGADLIVSRALELIGEEPLPGVAGLLEAAAGPALLVGTGATQYSDNLGDVLSLLAAQGVIPPVFLEFARIDLDPGLVEGEGEGEDVVPPVEEQGEHICILTNDVKGNVEIPVDFLLFIVGAGTGVTLTEVSLASIEGVDTNVFFTGNDHFIKFLIGGEKPEEGSEVEGEFTYTLSDGTVGTVCIIMVFEDDDEPGTILNGTTGNDILIGDDGPDVISGDTGDDVIYGGHDNSHDTLYGDAGDDIIFVDTNDTANGGADNDTFVFLSGGKNITIEDFDVVGGDATQDDVLDLSDLFADGDVDSGNVDGFVKIDGDELQVDLDGGGDDFETIATLTGVSTGDVLNVLIDGEELTVTAS